MCLVVSLNYLSLTKSLLKISPTNLLNSVIWHVYELTYGHTWAHTFSPFARLLPRPWSSPHLLSHLVYDPGYERTRSCTQLSFPAFPHSPFFLLPITFKPLECLASVPGWCSHESIAIKHTIHPHKDSINAIKISQTPYEISHIWHSSSISWSFNTWGV